MKLLFNKNQVVNKTIKKETKIVLISRRVTLIIVLNNINKIIIILQIFKMKNRKVIMTIHRIQSVYNKKKMKIYQSKTNKRIRNSSKISKQIMYNKIVMNLIILIHKTNEPYSFLVQYIKL